MVTESWDRIICLCSRILLLEVDACIGWCDSGKVMEEDGDDGEVGVLYWEIQGESQLQLTATKS